MEKDMNPTSTAWYVVQTKASSESVAELNLRNQAFRAFVPRLKASRRRGGRWQTIVEPMFPGYLFVQLDLNKQNIAPIRSTRGVVRLVHQGGVLNAVPAVIITTLFEAQEASEGAIEPSAFFNSGDEVELVSGPLEGLRGVFKAATSQERVIVLLNMLGNETLINVSQNRIAHSA